MMGLNSRLAAANKIQAANSMQNMYAQNSQVPPNYPQMIPGGNQYQNMNNNMPTMYPKDNQNTNNYPTYGNQAANFNLNPASIPHLK